MAFLSRAQQMQADVAAKIAAARELITPDVAPKPTFLRSSLKDSVFYAAHEKEIDAAALRGDIIDDVSIHKAGNKFWGKE